MKNEYTAIRNQFIWASRKRKTRSKPSNSKETEKEVAQPSQPDQSADRAGDGRSANASNANQVRLCVTSQLEFVIQTNSAINTTSTSVNSIGIAQQAAVAAAQTTTTAPCRNTTISFDTLMSLSVLRKVPTDSQMSSAPQSLQPSQRNHPVSISRTRSDVQGVGVNTSAIGDLLSKALDESDGNNDDDRNGGDAGTASHHTTVPTQEPNLHEAQAGNKSDSDQSSTS